jgi:iron complex outermembrane receptor protein
VQSNESWAVYVHGTYDISDVLSVTAGLRYTDDQKDVNVYRQDFVTGVVTIPNTGVSVEAQKTSPKIGLNWQINDNLMTYVQWATGFRGGGFGPRPSNSYQVANGSFGVEDLDTLEGGVKSDLRDGTLRLNGTIFFSEYTNQQQFSQQFDPTGAIWFRSVNTGKSEYTGAELELLATPVPQFTFEASVGFIQFDRVDAGTSGLCTSDPPGGHCMAPRTPEWTAALGATYRWDLANGGGLTVRGDAVYQSLMAFSTDPLNGFQPAHTLLDARLTWESSNQGWAIALFGTNLTDEEYFHGKLSLVGVLGREQGNVARPREWGVSLKRSF